MNQKSIFELIRTAEYLNNESMILFVSMFNKNVGVSQVLVLAELAEKGPQMQSRLSKRLGYTPGAMTGIANKLIKEGYAEREYDETDRRIIRIAITEKGTQLLQEAQKQGKKMRENLYSVLTEEEVVQLFTIQKKLIKQVLHLKSQIDKKE
jgi:DNA-binding MarR family transcriptional regulator